MRFLLKTMGFLLITGVVLAAAVLAWGHIRIQRLDPPLPRLDEVLELDRTSELPVRLSWINTASQRMPRAAVLEPEVDPDPDADYTMSHPAFVVEWQDGRIFLIDLGMDTADAFDFGAPIELVYDADPIVIHQSTSDRLGEDRVRVAGMAFTHMHIDHVGGISDFCDDMRLYTNAGERIKVFQNRHQVTEINHTTRPAKKALDEADCVKQQPLVSQATIQKIPGFPGIFVVAAAGHTPGSEVFVVHVRTFPGQSDGRYDDVQTWIITGDIANHEAGIEKNLPKPRLYSLFLVPENEERLAKVRSFLKELGRQPGVELLVSHHQKQIESTGLKPY